VFENSPFLPLYINSVIVTGSATLRRAARRLAGGPTGIAKSPRPKLGVLVLLARLTPGLSFPHPLYICSRRSALPGTALADDHHPSRHHRPIVAWIMIGSSRRCRTISRRPGMIDGCTLCRPSIA